MGARFGFASLVQVAEYTPRNPGASVLYAAVRDHFETFRVESGRIRGGDGLPRFVEDEFRAFLRCGWLAGGFARFRCDGCRTERVVAFSCKGRGFCPSCGGRRMAERAAHLVDDVLPDVPVRQWVLSLPHRVRYLLAWHHDLCRAVVARLMRAVDRFLRAWARDRGLRDARGGGVAVIQRFGGALNLNVHVHALILDGIYARGNDGRLRFHAAPGPSTADLADILAAVASAVHRLLARRGFDLDGENGTVDAAAEASPLLAELAAGSVQGLTLGSNQAQTRPRRLGQAPGVIGFREPHPCAARWEGFDLHAGVRVPAGQRDRLERVCRYALRPAVAGERLGMTADGDVILELRRPWADGTTQLAFRPTAFLARLAVLVPRPQVNLVLYHGVLAPRAAWRREIVSTPAQPVAVETTDGTRASEPDSLRTLRGHRWAALMQRVFALDVLACTRCGGRLRLVALLEASAVTARILRHLGLPDTVPRPLPSRAPPLDDWAA